jgi:hypothetical protein
MPVNFISWMCQLSNMLIVPAKEDGGTSQLIYTQVETGDAAHASQHIRAKS